MPGAKKYVIADNINLFIIKDIKYKTVYAAAYLHRDLSREEVTLNSLLSKVLRSSTKKHPSMNELSIYSQELYGCGFDVSVSKRASVQSIVSNISTLNDRFSENGTVEKAFELMLDLIFKPDERNGAFNAEYVENQKKNLKDDIESLINDKRAYANVRCLEEMCKGEKNAIVEVGYVEDIEEIDAVSLYKHYLSIVKSSPVDIFVVGDIDEQYATEFFKSYFEELEFNIKPLQIEFSFNDPNEEKYIEDNLDVNQGKLAMGLRTGINLENDMYYPLLVGNSIFGSGAHSKLFNNVREKLSLCYYAYSRLDKYNALMLIGSGIEFVNFEKTKNAILEELDNVKSGNFFDADIEVAKEYIIGSYISYNDSPSLLTDYYLGMCFSDSLLSVEEAVEAVRKVSRQQILDAFSNVKLDTVYFLNGKESN